MKRFNFFHAIFLSFYSKSLYRQVGERWRGRSFVYLLVLLATCWIVAAFAFNYQFWQEVNQAAPTIIQQMPIITFTHGVASTKPDRPILIKTPENILIAVIDVKNQFKEFEQSTAKIFMGSKTVQVKQDTYQTDTIRFPERLNGTFGSKEITAFFHQMKKWAIPLLYIFTVIFGVIGSYIFHVVQVLIYALLGLAFAALLKRKLNYAALLSLSLLAITPAIVLRTVLNLLELRFPLDFWLYFLVSMGYLYYAIKAMSREIG